MTAGSTRAPWAEGWQGTLLVVVGFLAFSAAFSWPAARLDPAVLATRHFDIYVLVWLLEQAKDGLPALLAPGSGWPAGESLARADSLLLMAISWAAQGLLPGWLLAGLCTWLAPALNALAAEQCARRVLAVRRPWSLLAGLAFGFSGIAAATILEGQVYLLLAAWLPLMITAAWTGPERSLPLGRGALLGLLWALALFSSAYLGIPATLLLLALLAARPGRVLRLLPGAALAALPAALLYLWLFLGRGTPGPVQEKPELILSMGSATVANLTGWSPLGDLVEHSLGAPLAFSALWLLLLAPLLLRGERGWRALALLALLALLLCFGRSLRLAGSGPGLPTPLAALAGLPGMELFRFPIRFAWLFALCAGLVGSAALQSLARRLPRRLVAPLLLAAALEALLGTALPWRLGRAVGTAPSAYAAAPQGRAVLDLYGRVLDGRSGELEMWTRSFACYYQASHGRPIPELCVDTEVDSPRERLDAALTAALLSLETPPDPARLAALRGGLQEQGIGAVALHRDFYRPADGALLQAGLEALLGPPAAESTDGGERLAVFRVETTP